MYCAARQGFVDIAIYLLNQPTIDLNYHVPEHGGTPLHGTTKQQIKKKKNTREVAIVNSFSQFFFSIFLLFFSLLNIFCYSFIATH